MDFEAIEKFQAIVIFSSSESEALDFALKLSRKILKIGNPRSDWLFDEGMNPDFLHLKPKEGKKQIGVEEIRQMIDFAQIPPICERKVVLINSIDDLNPSSNNALLKILEEPRSDLHFLILNHRFDLLMPTVRSRCQFFRIDCQEEHLIQLSQERVNDFLEIVLSPKISFSRLIYFSQQLETELKSFEQLLDCFQRFCSDLLLAYFDCPLRYFEKKRSDIVLLAERIEIKELFKFINQCCAKKRLVLHPLNVRTQLEELFLDFEQLKNNDFFYRG